MAELRILEFTDPGCPWAFSAEPFKRRLQWLYGDRLEWVPRMVVLSESPEDYDEKGLTTEFLAQGAAQIAEKHGMPIDATEKPRHHATAPACRAVVAARLRAPDRAERLLRALRVETFDGALLDQDATLEAAAATAGLDVAELRSWVATPEVEAALEEDKALARAPSPAAHVLDARLAGWEGGRRYTCPSYELFRADGDEVAVTIPGFQPFAVYDVVLANLLPDVTRREEPESVAEVLEWADFPLATEEVAVVCELGRDEAREALSEVATERRVGTDGFWTLAS